MFGLGFRVRVEKLILPEPEEGALARAPEEGLEDVASVAKIVIAFPHSSRVVSQSVFK